MTHVALPKPFDHVSERMDATLVGIPNRPLGTAAWLNGPSVVKPFEPGDFWLGKLANGDAVGIRDDRHAFIGCGTRGGKGVSILVPNLCMWPGSALVIDPKGENAMVTARRRANGSRYCVGLGQKVRILDPFNAVNTPEDDFADLKATFNPLAELHADKEESVDIASRIAESLIVSEASADAFWDDAAKEVLKGVILHVATAGEFQPHERNLGKVRQLVMEGDARAHKIAILAATKKQEPPSAIKLLALAMQRNRAFGGVIAETGAMVADLEKSPRTLAGILQSARTNTDFISSPAMRRCLSSSSFSLSELKTDPEGMSVYLCLEDRYMDTHFRWLRMMTTLAMGTMQRLRRQPACGHRVLMVLDEFPALRRMRVIENAAAQIAGYGVKLVFVVQTLPQLKEIYKDNWETLLANAGVKLFFCNDDHFTRQYVSQLIGDCEVVRTARSMSATTGDTYSHTKSESSGYSTGHSMGHSTGHTSNNSGGGDSHNMNTGWTSGHSMSSGTSTAYGSNNSTTAGYSENVHKRPLVNPDEIGRMFGNREHPRALALISGYQPLYLVRVKYFEELFLGGYYDAHADHPSPLPVRQALQKFKDHLRITKERAEAERLRVAQELRRKAEEDAAREAAKRRDAEATRRDLQEKIEADCRRRGRWEAAFSVVFFTGLSAAGGYVVLAVAVQLLMWLP